MMATKAEPQQQLRPGPGPGLGLGPVSGPGHAANVSPSLRPQQQFHYPSQPQNIAPHPGHQQVCGCFSRGETWFNVHGLCMRAMPESLRSM